MNNWETKRLGDIVETFSGGTPSTKEQGYYEGEIPFIKSGEMDLETTAQYLSEEGLCNSSAKMVDEGDILFALYGATSGEVAISKVSGAINQAVLCIRTTADKMFIYYLLLQQKSVILRTYLQGGQGNLSADIVKNIRVALPSQEEQKRIVGVLGVWDRALEGLDAKIALAERLKKGLMQQLLSGERRLPGFSGEWETKKLDSLLDYSQPTEFLVSSTDYDDSNGIPVLTAGKTFILGYTDEDWGIFSNIPVIIFDDFTTASKYVDFPFKAKSSAMKILKAKNGNSLRVLFGLLQLIDYTVGDHKRHWISEFSQFEVKIPPLPEQQAIAEVLEGADAGLDALRKKRSLIAAQKKFLLNNLVTGRIRVPENADRLDCGSSPQ